MPTVNHLIQYHKDKSKLAHEDVAPLKEFIMQDNGKKGSFAQITSTLPNLTVPLTKITEPTNNFARATSRQKFNNIYFTPYARLLDLVKTIINY